MKKRTVGKQSAKIRPRVDLNNFLETRKSVKNDVETLKKIFYALQRITKVSGFVCFEFFTWPNSNADSAISCLLEKINTAAGVVSTPKTHEFVMSRKIDVKRPINLQALDKSKLPSYKSSQIKVKASFLFKRYERFGIAVIVTWESKFIARTPA